MIISEIIGRLQEAMDECGDVECLIEVCDEQTGEFWIAPIGDLECDERDKYGHSVLFLI